MFECKPFYFCSRIFLGWRVVAFVLFGLLFNVGVWAQAFETIMAPGKLIQGHAKWEEECKQCHVKFDKNAQDGLCMDCHKDVGADVRAKTGFHGKGKLDSCKTCHTEHKGRDAHMVSLDTKQFDHEPTDFALHGKHQKVECTKCHVAGKKYRDAAHECVGCHKKEDVHKDSLGPKCASCHTENDWKEAKFDHNTARFQLLGKHADVKCAECHKSTNYREAPRQCFGCHRKDDDKKGHKGQYGEKCESCHNEKAWKPSIFRHDVDTKFALRGKHTETKCDKCHTAKLYTLPKLSQECYACHKKDDKHQESLGKNCGTCHTEKNWKESPKFDHAKSDFPLLGKHIKVECKECHKSAMFKEAPKDCYSCHKKDDKHKGTLGEKCADCHVEKDWKTTQGKFDHDKTKFVLRNAHAKPTVKCEACHKDLTNLRKTPLDCFSCHKKDDKHEGQEGKLCAQCHTDINWKVPKFDHGLGRFPLLGKHAPLECAKCHKNARFKDAQTACIACHVKDDKHKKTLGSECGQCHNARSWKDWTFDHDKRTKFVLDGKHKEQTCAACHTVPSEGKIVLATSCFACHRKDDVHEGSYGRQCQQCHIGTSFKVLKQKVGRKDGATSSLIPMPSDSSVRLSQFIPR
jgi:hypothetical protein